MNEKNSKQSAWFSDAQYRIENKKWLRYSSNIARRILAAIEDKEGFNQSDLASLLEVSPQHISQIVKGKENLSLKTIAKISEALGVELITFPEYKYSTPPAPLPNYVIVIKSSASDYGYADSEQENKFPVIENSSSNLAELHATANNYIN
jgi:transcriptional regulator with XRE-family HTH domain